MSSDRKSKRLILNTKRAYLIGSPKENKLRGLRKYFPEGEQVAEERV
jgi:hypothetical protein